MASLADGMQQKLAVASVLVLALLAGATVVLIQTGALNGNSHAPQQQGAQGPSAQSGTGLGGGQSSSGSGGSLLQSGPSPTAGSAGDDAETPYDQ